MAVCTLVQCINLQNPEDFDVRNSLKTLNELCIYVIYNYMIDTIIRKPTVLCKKVAGPVIETNNRFSTLAQFPLVVSTHGETPDSFPFKLLNLGISPLTILFRKMCV